MSDEAPRFFNFREALQSHLAKHLERERQLDQRICETCALGTWTFAPSEFDIEGQGFAAQLSYIPRRTGGGKIVVLRADLSQDFKEYKCPVCGTFEEFLGLRRRDVQ